MHIIRGHTHSLLKFPLLEFEQIPFIRRLPTLTIVTSNRQRYLLHWIRLIVCFSSLKPLFVLNILTIHW